ncbi:hypothetical protein GGR53DRAFT_428997 [Hypoxylon sp. FL1150]|nr:hypothetical protein GGR53DRAFT_428997 [Hypoxylon sp. FL1150]
MATFEYFGGFPAEIKTKILHLVDDPVTCTAVCREWQEILETKTFKQIQLSQRRLGDFARIVQGRRRKLVSHIWLRIEFPRYDCRRCGEIESRKEENENSLILGHAIEGLFVILSNWKKPHDLNPKGLTLELCQFSPSDSEHTFKDHNFQHDPYSEPPEAFRMLAAPQEMPVGYQSDPLHSWQGGVRLPFSWPIMQSSIRVATAPACPAQFNPPEVDVVTGLLIRQQYFRDFTPITLAAIFKSLVALEHIMYERASVMYPGSNHIQRGHVMLHTGFKGTLSCLPETLKQLSIYESDKKAFRDRIRGPAPAIWRLESALAIKQGSQNLEQLSTSYFIDAENFFQCGSSSWKWNKLKNLVLTSNLLDPNEAPKRVNDLLEAAGATARNMPNLGTMEIWHGKGSTHGCIFRFSTDDNSSTITWHSTWEIKLEDRVIDSWKKTVDQNTRHENLGVVFEALQLNLVYPASVLSHLKLKDLVVCPISFRQIQLIGKPIIASPLS